MSLDRNEKPSPPAAFDAVAEAKMLLRTTRAGALATVAPSSGDPFASLVNVATHPDGRPILLMSRLAAHTTHLSRDPRLSLLLARAGAGDPLAHARLTLVGKAERIDDAAARAAARTRFLSRHPAAELYADFGDFSFWTVGIDSAHLNGGFARAAGLAGGDVLTPIEGAAALIEAEDGAVAHMNADHRAALALYATNLCGMPAGDWRASGLDPEGIDLACDDLSARVVFPTPVQDPQALRRVLVTLVDHARDRPNDGER